MPRRKLHLSTKKGSSLHKYRKLADPTNINNHQDSDTDSASEDDVDYVTSTRNKEVQTEEDTTNKHIQTDGCISRYSSEIFIFLDLTI